MALTTADEIRLDNYGSIDLFNDKNKKKIWTTMAKEAYKYTQGTQPDKPALARESASSTKRHRAGLAIGRIPPGAYRVSGHPSVQVITQSDTATKRGLLTITTSIDSTAQARPANSKAASSKACVSIGTYPDRFSDVSQSRDTV
jgi:hypothetical protein